MSHKPAIPPAPSDPQRARFDGALKECLEILMARRVEPIRPLPADATLAQVVAKLNELLVRLQ